VMDDQLNILPLSSHISSITPLPPAAKDAVSAEQKELEDLKYALRDTQPVGVIVKCCKTLDQAKAVLKFVEAISEKTLRTTVALTAARGRGKSAAMGLAISSAVAFGYSNIFVTSPSPENLKTLFEFVFKGFDALEFQEHTDYELIQSTNPEFNKAVVRVNIFKDHRQTIQYIHPSDAHKLGTAELVVIDEAAAIPLPLVRALLGPYLVFMASTINGYEGTGRSLSLKLIQQLRQQASSMGAPGSKAATTSTSVTGRVLHEVQLNESIRYGTGDEVERWLNDLLCLDCTVAPHIGTGCPAPQDCDLYYINRDTLFCYHKASEAFLQRLMSLYVASHYKNSPNDLQMLSDAPAHHLFCLLGPVAPNQTHLPDVLCVVQVCLEGDISRASVNEGLTQGKRPSGDLIPWTVTQQFQDENFARLCGGRVVRIATHPDYQKIGYGRRALEMLQKYYEGRIPNVNEGSKSEPTQNIDPVDEEEVELQTERVVPRKSLPPLLLKLSERPAERLDWLGVSYGITADLLRFWKKSGYVPVYLRQTANDLTGEHSCVMLKALNIEEEGRDTSWLPAFWTDFRQRLLALMGYQFRGFTPSMALGIAQMNVHQDQPQELTVAEMESYISKYDLRRLEMYSRNLLDYHVIMDLMPVLARLYFLQRLGDLHFTAVQAALLLGIGLQHKTVDDLAKELELPSQQLMGLFNRAIRRITKHLQSVKEASVSDTVVEPKPAVFKKPLMQTLEEELDDAAAAVEPNKRRKKAWREGEEGGPITNLIKESEIEKYAVHGTEEEWGSALSGGSKELVSVKRFFNVKPLAGSRYNEIVKSAREAQFSGKKNKNKYKKK